MVLPIRTKEEENERGKKEERRIEKQKTDFSAATKKTREITWVGHVHAKGKKG